MLTKSKGTKLFDRGRVDVEVCVAAVGERGGRGAVSGVVRKSISWSSSSGGFGGGRGDMGGCDNRDAEDWLSDFGAAFAHWASPTL